MIKKILLMLMMLCPLWAVSAKMNGTQTRELSQWAFRRATDSEWTRVRLPHSTNAVDGQSAEYYRGEAMYRTEVKLKDTEGQNYFLIFKSAAQAATILVNGRQAATHKGGYTPFTVDITRYVREGRNEIEVRTDNTMDLTMPPVSSDFNKNNGLHDRVYLLCSGPIYINTSTMGYSGLHVRQQNVSRRHADLIVETQLMNTAAEKREVTVEVALLDAQGRVVVEASQPVSIDSGLKEGKRVRQVLGVDSPHLWDGLDNPYLYNIRARVIADGTVVEDRTARIGLRDYYVDPERGFLLNGRSYPLRGVAYHQDKYLRASAVTDDDIRRDFRDIRELGCNFLRLAHYPHNELTFDLCDELGIVVQTEIPWVNEGGPDTSRFDQLAYQRNILSAFREMVRGHFNHPSIVFWGMWNELGHTNAGYAQGRPIDADFLVETTTRMYRWGKQNDPDRYYGFADMGYGMSIDALRRGINYDYYAMNKYHGWYTDQHSPYGAKGLSGALSWLKKKRECVAITEYGAGSNPFAHSSDPAKTTQPATGGARHDEEWANILHEIHLATFDRAPYLAFTSDWVLYDFAVAARREGYVLSEDMVTERTDSNFLYTNDKGLITRDRRVKKDVFYLYKAKWNRRETTVYITSRRYTVRPEDEVAMKVYSNACQLSLYQNGRLVQTLQSSGEPTGVIWNFAPVHFEKPTDTFRVVGLDGEGRKTVDEVRLSRAKNRE